MKMLKRIAVVLMAALLVVGLVGLTGCEKETAADKANKEVNKLVDKLKN